MWYALQSVAGIGEDLSHSDWEGVHNECQPGGVAVLDTLLVQRYLEEAQLLIYNLELRAGSLFNTGPLGRLTWIQSGNV